MALAPGARIGVYEVAALIGVGGMGEVYRARDTKLDRDVAIKVLPEAFTHDAERVARFQREAKTLASLNHPNIAQIYGLEEGADVTALVMELVEGPTLEERLRTQGSGHAEAESLRSRPRDNEVVSSRGGGAPRGLEIDDVLPIAKQIADALEAAHEQGIIHRDLKPANVKVRPDGAVKVLDFGLAKAVQTSGSGLQAPGVSQSPTITTPAMTQAGMILGTAAYLAPEQAKGRATDKRADIWAFGAVLYEMLTGRRAFARDDVAETLAVVLTKEPDWSALPASTPVELRRLLTRCLKKDPKVRMRDIGEARLQIEALLNGAREEGAGAAPVVAARASSRFVATLPWVLAALAMGVAIGAFMWRRGGQSPSPVRFLVLPPDSAAFVGTQLHQAISPDGRHLAFVARVNGGPSMVWIRSLGEVTARMLTGTEGARTIFWSPDSSELGFTSEGMLKRTAVTNGTVQKVTDAAPTLGGVSGSWNRDDTILFGPGQDGRLYRVRARGGAASPATPPGESDGATIHLMPQFLPDGARFLYFSRQGGDVLLGTLDGSAPKHLLKADCKALYSANHLLFIRESTLFAQPFLLDAGEVSGEPTVVASGVRCNPSNGGGGFSVSDNGVLTYRGGDAGEIEQMTWVDRAGKVDGLVGEAANSYDLALSPDGKVVASNQLSGPGDIWLTDVLRKFRIRLVSSASVNRLPVWSADSAWVVFASDRDGGTFHLYRKSTNRSEAEEPLLKTSGNKNPTDWSSDGRFLLYDETGSTTASDIWVLPLSGDRKPFLYIQTKFTEGHGAFSPDGQWVAFTSDENGQRQVYVQPFPPTGARWPVSVDGGTHPQWRRDQKELFYFDLERRMVAVAVNVSGPSPDVGTPQILFRTNAPPDLGWNRRFYSVRSDGQQFLISNVAEGLQTPPITVVLNWMAGPER